MQRLRAERFATPPPGPGENDSHSRWHGSVTVTLQIRVGSLVTLALPGLPPLVNHGRQPGCRQGGAAQQISDGSDSLATDAGDSRSGTNHKDDGAVLGNC